MRIETIKVSIERDYSTLKYLMNDQKMVQYDCADLDYLPYSGLACIVAFLIHKDYSRYMIDTRGVACEISGSLIRLGRGNKNLLLSATNEYLVAVSEELQVNCRP
jgi:hypothetical protein